MAQQVLHLPELLENIFLSLPMKDLLFSQKVCRTWKAVVDTSPHIQEALFYTTDTHESTATSVATVLLLTYSGYYGMEATDLGHLLYNNSLHPNSSCHRMLLGKPTRDTEIFFEIQPVSNKFWQWEATDITGQLVGVFVEYDGFSDLGLTKAKFMVGATLGETMRRYEKVVEELHEGHFKPVNTYWRFVHI
ncbi:hypothetical protein LTS10_010441 [Elasticomyces elasticus]|nr:hypothetical protein LTS10_010441 [Elasticomyces elasticus]